MTWFKVDDGFYDHPKVVDLPLAAVGLWALAGAYCARHLTDGVITDRQIRAIGGTRKQAAALVSAGLWSADDAPPSARRYAFNDWGDFQPSRADVEAKREEARERMAAARARKRKTSGNGKMFARTNGERSQEVRSDGLSERSHYPDPSRPDPTRPLLTTGRGEYVREVGGDAAQAPPPEIPAEWIDRPSLARCPEHVGMTDAPACWKCRDAREAATAAATERHRAENARIAADAAARLACDLCDETGHVVGDDGAPLVPAIPCTHQEDANAELVLAARQRIEAQETAEAERRAIAAKAAAEARARWKRDPEPEPQEVPSGPF